MNMQEILDRYRADEQELVRRHTSYAAIERVRSACLAGGGRSPSVAEAASVSAARQLINSDRAVINIRRKIEDIEADMADDTRAAEMSRHRTLTPYGEAAARSDAPAQYSSVGYENHARVGYEQRTYNPDTARGVGVDRREGNVSFFADAYRFQVANDPAARERIMRHAAEVERSGEMSDRSMSSGGFAGLVIPQYLIDLAALQLRAGRPFANTCTSLPLPESGMVFQIPKGTTGASTAIQAVENTSVSATDEQWNNISLNVATGAGQQDVSRQSLERGTPGIDQIVYMDLAGAYGVTVNQQTLSGSGSANQVLGVLNTAGIGQASAYTAAASLQTFYSKVNGQVAGIAGTRFLPPTHVAMVPRRSSWLANQFDSSGRPIVVPSNQGPQNAAGVDIGTAYGPGGSLLNMATLTDASIPTAVGAASEDLTLVYRASDLLLFEEGDGMPRELRFEQTLAQQLTIKLVSFGYFAFTAARFPQSVGVIGGNSALGNGQVAPTF